MHTTRFSSSKGGVYPTSLDADPPCENITLPQTSFVVGNIAFHAHLRSWRPRENLDPPLPTAT